jgi:uroporphyrinogen-III synthase
MPAVTVVLTQPAPRVAALADRLRAAGLAPLALPMTEIVPTGAFDAAALAATFAACRWVLWPSPGAIDAVLGAFAARGLGWPAGTGVGVVGPGSREALAGWHDAVPGLAAVRTIEPTAPPFDAEALLAHPELAAPAGVPIAVPRRADGREAWLDALRARGATVHALDVYASRPRETPPAEADALRAALDARGPLAFSVASAEAGVRLAAVAARIGRDAAARARPVLTQHPRIAQALAAQGWRDVRTHAPGTEALAAAIESARDAPR